MRSSFFAVASAALLLVAAGAARAVPIAYEIQVGSSNGFTYSYIHSATGTAGMAPYYPSGSLLFELTGTISGTWDGSVLTVSNSTLQAEALTASGLTPGDVYNLTFTGGSVQADGLGTLDFTFDAPGYPGTGTFYFFAEDFVPAANVNSVSATGLALWGNNWDNWATSRPDVGALGIDLKGPGAAVPEPGAALVFAAGALLIGATTRRRR